MSKFENMHQEIKLILHNICNLREILFPDAKPFAAPFKLPLQMFGHMTVT